MLFESWYAATRHPQHLHAQRGGGRERERVTRASEREREPSSKIATTSLQDLFREWDTDGNGELSLEEFRRAMPLLGIHAAQKETDGLFYSMDHDADGIVTFREFNRALRRANEGIEKESRSDPWGQATTSEWRPKSPVVQMVDLGHLRQHIKAEHRLRGLETGPIEFHRVKSLREKALREMKI